MTSYLVFCSLFIFFTITKGEPTAKPEGSPDSNAQSFVPVMQIHPPLVPFPHPGIYPPGFPGPIVPQHLDIFQQPQYGHGGEINKDQLGVKKDYKLVQKQVDKKGKQLNKGSKVKKVYTDGRGGIQTKTEKLISGHEAHGIGLSQNEYAKGIFPEHLLPYHFSGGHLPPFGHAFTLPYQYHFPGFGFPGQHGHILGAHGYRQLGYGFPPYAHAAAQTVDYALANPAFHLGQAKTHIASGLGGKGGLNNVAGHVSHGAAHLYHGQGTIAPTPGHGIGPFPLPHGHLHGINPVVHIAGPLHHGYTEAIVPPVHSGHPGPAQVKA